MDKTLRAAQGIRPSGVMLSRVHVVYSHWRLSRAWEKRESEGPKVVRCSKMACAVSRSPSVAALMNSEGR